MIIKLAIEKHFEKTLSKEERGKYKAIKAGALAGGSLLGGLNLAEIKNELKPEVGRVRRFLIERNLANPRSGEMVRKFHATLPRALTMGSIGVAAGGVIGLGTHLLHQKAKQLKQKSR